MRRPLTLLALALALLAPIVAIAAPRPYTARYEVLRNGERLGEATVRFAALANGRYDFTSRTQGSGGLAAVLGVTINERSILRWTGGRPETVAYSLDQKIGWKDKQRSLKVDANAGRVTSTDKGQEIALAYSPGVLDRHAVSIALMQDLAAGAKGELTYTVAERRAIGTQRFRQSGTDRLDTALGAVQAVQVDRIRDSGDGRTTQFWLAGAHGFVPVRMLQKEPDGESIEMRIIALD